MEAFNNSIGFDKRFWKVDIRGSIEYAQALARAGILTLAEAAELKRGLLLVSHKIVNQEKLGIKQDFSASPHIFSV